MTVQVDFNEWPLVIARYSGPTSVDELQIYVTAMIAALDRNEPHGLLVLADRTSTLALPARRALTRFVSERKADLVRLNVGCAFVIPSPMVRGILHALFAVAAQPTPYTIVSDEVAGRAWLQQRMAERDAPAAR